MSASDVVGAGKVVTLHYTLTNEAGETLDSSQDSDPLAYLHGADNIVPGLETALEGRSVGDRVTVTVPPEQGYGVRDDDGVQTVPRRMFPSEEEIVAGDEYVTKDEDGNPLPVWVVGADEETVTLDFNHPLAGETLHFDVTVVALREAAPEELEHGHPHGPHGHVHGEDDELS